MKKRFVYVAAALILASILLALNFNTVVSQGREGFRYSHTVLGKLVVRDSVRVGSTATFNGAATFNSTAAFTGGILGKLVVQDSVRVGSTATFNGAATFNSTAAFTGAITGASIKPTALVFNSFDTKAIPVGVLGTADTLALASSTFSWIKIRGTSGSTDSVTHFTGGVSGQFYIFSAVADDTTIHINDGGNIKAATQLVLDALTDRVLFMFDGTNFIQLAALVSND